MKILKLFKVGRHRISLALSDTHPSIMQSLTHQRLSCCIVIAYNHAPIVVCASCISLSSPSCRSGSEQNLIDGNSWASTHQAMPEWDTSGHFQEDFQEALSTIICPEDDLYRLQRPLRRGWKIVQATAAPPAGVEDWPLNQKRSKIAANTEMVIL